MTHVDNEYARAGIQDPRIVITTSRDPSSKLSQFAKVSIFEKLSSSTGSYPIQFSNRKWGSYFPIPIESIVEIML